MQTLVALYHSFEKAHRAVEELVRNGVSRDRISVVASDASGHYAKEYGTRADASTNDAVTAGQGAAFGAASGGVIGILAGLGALALPGIGPVVAAGPLVAALTGGVLGVAAGAPTGGVVAALVHTNKITQEEAELYAEGVRRGDTLLSVEADDTMTVKVREILDRYDPLDIRTQAAEYRSKGWQAFDPNAVPYSAQEIETWRSRYSGAATSPTPVELTGRAAMGAVRDASTTSNLDTTGDFETYDQDFRQHYTQNYVSSPRSYEEYVPVYRYGYEVATSPLYKDREWGTLEADLRHDWEKQNPDTPWDQFRDAVRYAWDRVRGVAV
jgi:hypothetical protein